MHTRAYGRTLHMPNWHPSWPLHRAEVLHLDEELVAAAGLPAPVGPPVSVLYSPGVEVRFGPPAAAGRAVPGRHVLSSGRPRVRAARPGRPGPRRRAARRRPRSCPPGTSGSWCRGSG
ncbi:DUF2071 domain-containing protein [Micromonospora sp. M12]